MDGQQFQTEDDDVLFIQLRKAACCRYEYIITVQYVSITWDIKAVPYITVRYWDGAPWRHVPVRLVLHFEDSLCSPWVWLLFLFVDSALYCGQCTVLWTVFWDFLEACHHSWSCHCLPHVVVKDRSCASTSNIRLHDVFRDSFNTIHIGIVTN